MEMVDTSTVLRINPMESGSHDRNQFSSDKTKTPNVLAPVFTSLGSHLLCAGAIPLRAQDDTLEDDFKKTPGPGQLTFSSTCAGCHGLDGRGGDKAPNIASNTKVQHLLTLTRRHNFEWRPRNGHASFPFPEPRPGPRVS